METDKTLDEIRKNVKREERAAAAVSASKHKYSKRDNRGGGNYGNRDNNRRDKGDNRYNRDNQNSGGNYQQRGNDRGSSLGERGGGGGHGGDRRDNCS